VFQIKKNIPVPAARAFGTGRPGRYPYADMEVGDCFDVAVGDEKAEAVLRRLRASSASWKKRAGAACGFSVRTLVEEGVPLVRVWKTAPKPAKA